MGISAATILLYIAIGERLVRLWQSLKRATARKKERDEQKPKEEPEDNDKI